MSYSVTVQGIQLTLKNFNKLDTWVQASQVPTGPLVNISALEGKPNTPYTVTVLAYLPVYILKNVRNTSGLSLMGDLIYLNYYGGTLVKVIDKGGEEQEVLCRDFRIEFNSEENAERFYMCYVQFEYQLLPGTPFVDGIIVRDQDDDPELDRGTVTMPAKDED